VSTVLVRKTHLPLTTTRCVCVTSIWTCSGTWLFLTGHTFTKNVRLGREYFWPDFYLVLGKNCHPVRTGTFLGLTLRAHVSSRSASGAPALRVGLAAGGLTVTEPNKQVLTPEEIQRRKFNDEQEALVKKRQDDAWANTIQTYFVREAEVKELNKRAKENPKPLTEVPAAWSVMYVCKHLAEKGRVEGEDLQFTLGRRNTKILTDEQVELHRMTGRIPTDFKSNGGHGSTGVCEACQAARDLKMKQRQSWQRTPAGHSLVEKQRESIRDGSSRVDVPKSHLLTALFPRLAVLTKSGELSNALGRPLHF
jgi:hypothetical protein